MQEETDFRRVVLQGQLELADLYRDLFLSAHAEQLSLLLDGILKLQLPKAFDANGFIDDIKALDRLVEEKVTELVGDLIWQYQREMESKNERHPS